MLILASDMIEASKLQIIWDLKNVFDFRYLYISFDLLRDAYNDICYISKESSTHDVFHARQGYLLCLCCWTIAQHCSIPTVLCQPFSVMWLSK